jgi:hypothetical protein
VDRIIFIYGSSACMTNGHNLVFEILFAVSVFAFCFKVSFYKLHRFLKRIYSKQLLMSVALSIYLKG